MLTILYFTSVITTYGDIIIFDALSGRTEAQRAFDARRGRGLATAIRRATIDFKKPQTSLRHHRTRHVTAKIPSLPTLPPIFLAIIANATPLRHPRTPSAYLA
jgi:hypothetical protein